MTLRKYRRIGQLPVVAVFANRTERRVPSGALADGDKRGDPAEFTEKELSGLSVLGNAGARPTAVSLQGHDEHSLHNAALCAVSSC